MSAVCTFKVSDGVKYSLGCCRCSPKTGCAPVSIEIQACMRAPSMYVLPTRESSALMSGRM